jgi:hypothetical protein
MFKILMRALARTCERVPLFFGAAAVKELLGGGSKEKWSKHIRSSYDQST